MMAVWVVMGVIAGACVGFALIAVGRRPNPKVNLKLHEGFDRSEVSEFDEPHKFYVARSERDLIDLKSERSVRRNHPTMLEPDPIPPALARFDRLHKPQEPA